MGVVGGNGSPTFMTKKGSERRFSIVVEPTQLPRSLSGPTVRLRAILPLLMPPSGFGSVTVDRDDSCNYSRSIAGLSSG